MRERRTAGGEIATSSKRASNKRTLTNRLLFYKKGKRAVKGLLCSAFDVWQNWWIVVEGWWWETQFDLRRLSFLLGILVEGNTPYLARSRGGWWGHLPFWVVSQCRKCNQTFTLFASRPSTNCPHLHNIYQKIQTMYRKPAQNTHLVSKKQLTIRKNRANMSSYRVGVIR